MGRDRHILSVAAVLIGLCGFNSIASAATIQIDADLTISKTGLITLGMSVGDDDAGTETSPQWPTEKMKFVVIERPLVLSVNGGENASGAWSFDGKATINMAEETHFLRKLHFSNRTDEVRD